MIHDSISPFFDQYNSWLYMNRWNIIMTANWIASLILLMKIKTQLIVMYWSKRECNTKFFSHWITKKEFLKLIPKY